MILITYLSSAMIVLLLFSVLPKKLSFLEVLFSWMVIVYLYGSVMANILLNNPDHFKMNPNLYYVWTLAFNRFVFLPLLIVWLLDLLSWTRHWALKLLLILVFLNLLVGLEYLYGRMNIIRYKQEWNFFWPYLYWLLTIVIVYASQLWFRRKLSKEMKLK